MRTLLLITIVVSGMGGAVGAQSLSEGMNDLESCFQSAREADAICSNPTNDPAQRLECFQKARAAQLECLEHAAAGTSAAPAAPDLPTAAVSPQTPAVAAAPDKPDAVTPADNPAAPAKPAIAAPPDMPAVVVEAPARRSATAWVVSQTTSPVDYTPFITAALRSTSGANSLVIRCLGPRTELSVHTEEPWRLLLSGEMPVTLQIDDQPVVKLSWTESPDGRNASFKGDAAELVQSLPEGARLNISVFDRPDSGHDAAFQLTGLDGIRKKIGTSCKWTPASVKTSDKPPSTQVGGKKFVTVGKSAPTTTAGRSSSLSPAVPSNARLPTAR